MLTPITTEFQIEKFARFHARKYWGDQKRGLREHVLTNIITLATLGFQNVYTI